MTEPTYSALRAYNNCVAGMMADPEVTGDLLLVGLWLARAVHLRDPEPLDTGWQMVDMARDLFPIRTKTAMYVFGEWSHGQETAPDSWHLAEVLKKDIRRYDMWADQPIPRGTRTLCGGPMVRRDLCGKPANIWTFLTDPTTGRRRMIGACRKHGEWYAAEHAANQAACAATQVPRPAANAGGRLARHISIDWPALWSGLDPDWSPPPEVESWTRPSLRLVVSPSVPVARVAQPSRPRPRFALIEGART